MKLSLVGELFCPTENSVEGMEEVPPVRHE